MESYEVKLGYLMYEATSNRLSFPMQVRERHLTQETRDVTLQAIGTQLQIAIWSSRDNILIRIPLKNWFTSDTFDGTLSGGNGGILSVGRFEQHIANEDDVIVAEVKTHNLCRP